MTNGIHNHRCNKCGSEYECAKVTHCKQEYYVEECYDCLLKPEIDSKREARERRPHSRLD